MYKLASRCSWSGQTPLVDLPPFEIVAFLCAVQGMQFVTISGLKHAGEEAAALAALGLSAVADAKQQPGHDPEPACPVTRELLRLLVGGRGTCRCPACRMHGWHAIEVRRPLRLLQCQALDRVDSSRAWAEASQLQEQEVGQAVAGLGRVYELRPGLYCHLYGHAKPAKRLAVNGRAGRDTLRALLEALRKLGSSDGPKTAGDALIANHERVFLTLQQA